jgi:hypothetical protein
MFILKHDVITKNYKMEERILGKLIGLNPNWRK